MKKAILILTSLLFTVFLLGAFVVFDNSNQINNTIEQVKIGNQTWMAKNLNVDKFRNGDLIPQAKSNEEWEKAGEEGKPAWCYYLNIPQNQNSYGKLYNWYAVNDPRGLAPAGWKVPTNEDWVELVDFLGDEINLGKKMKSIELWADFDEEFAYGTNESGFSGLPGGGRDEEGDFYGFGESGFWWSSTDESSDMFGNDVVLYCWLHYSNRFVVWDFEYKENGYSVRCLREE